jgi:hypothetical protein
MSRVESAAELLLGMKVRQCARSRQGHFCAFSAIRSPIEKQNSHRHQFRYVGGIARKPSRFLFCLSADPREPCHRIRDSVLDRPAGFSRCATLCTTSRWLPARRSARCLPHQHRSGQNCLEWPTTCSKVSSTTFCRQLALYGATDCAGRFSFGGKTKCRRQTALAAISDPM